MILIFSFVALCFLSLYFLVDYFNDKALSAHENPYNKNDLHQATIDLLEDENYRNQILPEELNSRLKNEESIFIYFYSPTCSYCMELSPRLVPLAVDLNIDLKLLNLLEFEEAWEEYEIESTPTIAYFENGKPIATLKGAQSNQTIKSFFEKYTN